MLRFLSSWLWSSSLVIGLFSIDFISKWWIVDQASKINTSNESSYLLPKNVFEDFFGIDFSIVHATNYGAAWGLFSNWTEELVFVRILFVLLLTYYLFSKKFCPEYRLPLSLIISGAAGNICDYFLYGSVVDMMAFSFGGWQYPVFNVADMSICIGSVLLAFIGIYDLIQKGSQRL